TPAPMDASECAMTTNSLCRSFSHVLLGTEDVDVEDSSDANLRSTYAKDIYTYLRELEEKQPIRPKYLSGQAISGHMRAMLIDWIVQVQIRMKLVQETLYLTVAVLDRFLQDNAVSKKMLQLVGITALFIASKYEEIYPPKIGDITYISNETYSKPQIRHMEMKILRALNFGLGHPLPLHFLRQSSEIEEVDLKCSVLTNYLMELSLLDYDMVHFAPSKTAASCLALKILDKRTATLQCLTSYTESDLLPVMQHMAKNIILTNEGIIQLTAIKNKYASRKNCMISLIEELKSPMLWNLAQPLLK
ncbi:CCNB1 protein, partial [Chloroceryle aenea]|nr:CCNB1 protein [Chloroceryle aenea]